MSQPPPQGICMTAQFINALRNEEVNGEGFDPTRFYLNSKDGEGASLSYAFYSDLSLQPSWAIGDEGFGDPAGSFRPFTAKEMSFARAAFAQVMATVNLTITEVTEKPASFLPNTDKSATVNLGAFDINGARITGYTDFPLYYMEGGTFAGFTSRGNQLWIDSHLKSKDSNHVIVHEIGHSLGLKHTFEGESLNTYEQMFSQMSYNTDTKYKGFTFMDLAALQQIYGPAQRKMEDTTHVFGKQKLIWDGGGNDTITAISSKEKVYINLNDGSWVWTGKKTDYISDSKQYYLGDHTIIENAVGSKYNDKIVANEFANILRGSGGHDTFRFTSGEKLAGDLISDFRHGDKIDLRYMDLKWNDVSYDRASDILTIHDGENDYAMTVKGVNALYKYDFLL